MPGKREDYISWDTYFMLMPLLAKDRSKDPRTQVGAIIVKDNRVLSTGYNGTPRGMNDDDMPWDSIGEETGEFLKIKNTYVVHAEANSLMYYRGNNDDLKGATMYVTLFPCNECAKMIVSYGIGEIVYLQMYGKEEKVKASKIILEEAGVKIRQITDFSEMKRECENMKAYLQSIEDKTPFIRKMRPKRN